jgi:hypothetical protein
VLDRQPYFDDLVTLIDTGRLESQIECQRDLGPRKKPYEHSRDLGGSFHKCGVDLVITSVERRDDSRDPPPRKRDG